MTEPTPDAPVPISPDAIRTLKIGFRPEDLITSAPDCWVEVIKPQRAADINAALEAYAQSVEQKPVRGADWVVDVAVAAPLPPETPQQTITFDAAGQPTVTIQPSAPLPTLESVLTDAALKAFYDPEEGLIATRAAIIALVQPLLDQARADLARISEEQTRAVRVNEELRQMVQDARDNTRRTMAERDALREAVKSLRERVHTQYAMCGDCTSVEDFVKDLDALLPPSETGEKG